MSRKRKAGAVSLAVGISAACFFAGCSASIESAQHRGSAARVVGLTVEIHFNDAL